MEQSMNVAGVRASDGTLLEQFASWGDQAAFSELIRRHGPMVVRICRRLNGGDAYAADDAAQQVFLTLASRADALKTRTSLAGWLYRTSWHVAARHRRAEGVRAGHEQQAAEGRGSGDLASGSPDDIPFAVIASELSAALSRALGTLPENYRNALVLHHLAGHTVEETAHLMEVKVGTAASWLSRGRTALRAKLEAMGYAISVSVVCAWLEADAAAAREASRAACPTGGAGTGSVPPGSLGGEASGALALGVPVPACSGAAAAGTAAAAAVGVSAPGTAASLLGLSRMAAVAAGIMTCGTVAAAGHALATGFAGIRPAATSAASNLPPKTEPAAAAAAPRHVRSSSQWSNSGSSSSPSPNVVPEPSSCVIFLAAGGLALLRRPARRESPGG